MTERCSASHLCDMIRSLYKCDPGVDVGSEQMMMMMWGFLQMRKEVHVFVLLALLGLSMAEEGARLLASKSLLNRYAVEGRDLTLQYNIYNVGSR